jgi:histidine triad (HIT) family protein
MEENNCIFCQIVTKAIKSNIVYEDELTIAVLDINPATNGHTIIMPKTHFNSLYEMPQKDYLGLLSIARAVAYAILLSMGVTNVDLVYTQELRKGNFTPHALIHAIPRYNDDTVNYVWQPKTVGPDELSQFSATISDAIEKVKSSGNAAVSYGQVQSPTPTAQTVIQKQKEENIKEPPKPAEKPVELKKKIVIF